MKCDELKEYYYYEDRVVTPATHMYRVYHADKVDAAIAELKARIQLDDDEMEGFLQLEEECGGGDLRNYIAELNAKLDEKDAEIESLKASHYAENVDLEMTNKKLQDELTKLKAQMPEYKKFIEEEEFRKKLVDEYAGYVYDWKGRHYIATPYLNIFIKGILRALWLYRATTAKHLVTAYENYDYLDCQEMTIKQENARTWMTCKLRTAEEWVKVWKNVERKCRAKAEQYK